MPTVSPQRPTVWRQLGRALRWRCSECGITPIFAPLRATRSLRDWFQPLDGCPRCGYAYDKEPGYFLLSTWVLNYGVVSALGLAIFFTLYVYADLTPTWILLATLLPMPLFSILLARHAKALFLFVDHIFDPQAKGARPPDAAPASSSSSRDEAPRRPAS